MTEQVENPNRLRSTVQAVTSVGKDVVAFLRDSALFILAILLLVFPAKFNETLSNAGFEEGSFVGLKWKPKLLDSNAKLEAAQTLINDLQAQNERLSAALSEAEKKANDPALTAEVTKIQETNKELAVTTGKVENAVSQTIKNNAELVSRVQTVLNDKWVVVLGADTTLDAAKHEVQTTAPRLGISNATIHLRQRSFRTVVVTNSRDEADEILSRATGLRRGAQVVKLSSWCLNPIERNGYLECSGS